MLNIAVLVSGSGTNLQALINACKNGKINNGRIVLVVSSKPGVLALERARLFGIETAVVERKSYSSSEEYDKALLDALNEKEIDLIVLAGFLSILGPAVIEHYRNKIINVHPSLIPAFCGKGYYGLKVHEAVLAAGVKVTGATVHFVNEVPDGGPIILQKCIEVLPDDTPEILQQRVMEEAEWKILPEAVALFCEGRIEIQGNKTRILK